MTYRSIKGNQGFKNEEFDVYLSFGVVEHFEQGPIKALKEARRVLKKGGDLIIIDWKANQYMGPPENLITSPENIKKITKEKGLSFEKDFPVDKYHWGMIFRK